MIFFKNWKFIKKFFRLENFIQVYNFNFTNEFKLITTI